jgi:hypothetical protein
MGFLILWSSEESGNLNDEVWEAGMSILSKKTPRVTFIQYCICSVVQDSKVSRYNAIVCPVLRLFAPLSRVTASGHQNVPFS